MSAESLARSREGDLRVEDHGSVFLLRPLSEAGDDWITEMEHEAWQRFGHCLAVDPRLVPELVAAAHEAELDLRFAKRDCYEPKVAAKKWAGLLRRRRAGDPRLN
jgi:hypothetical protein